MSEWTDAEIEAARNAGPWAMWSGGDCPVDPELPVQLRYRGPEDSAKGVRITAAPAGRLDWSHDGSDDDITAYRPFDPFASVFRTKDEPS